MYKNVIDTATKHNQKCEKTVKKKLYKYNATHMMRNEEKENQKKKNKCAHKPQNFYFGCSLVHNFLLC